VPSVRKVNCGALDASAAGQIAELSGWVHGRRDHGGLLFLDVRDRDGITQVVFDPQQVSFEQAQSLRSEDVIRVRGEVRLRPHGTQNAKLATGAIELAATDLEILNRSLTPPFSIAGEGDVAEPVRMRYRYLDLRRPKMQRNLTVRHRIIKAMRDYFDDRGFIEIETPCMIKSTPEGARDFLVPSRLNRGTFYALPQSPQILKQILMIGGLGRYMQIARCFRDEDPRADRQTEFTQIDVELTFVDQDDVMDVMEGCMRSVWQRVLDATFDAPFPRFTYADAIRRFGSDKPDIRFGLELVDAIDLFGASEFSLFRTLAGARGNRIAVLRYPGGAALSRRDFDALTEQAKSFGAKGLAYITLGDEVKGPVAKFFDPATIAALVDRSGARPGDALLFVADRSAEASDVAGKLRLEIADRLGLRKHGEWGFCWVSGFPLFERDPDTGTITFAHHPFTSPRPGQEHLFDTSPLEMVARHYDMVLNGYELGSGSIRNHDPEFQRRVFKVLGLSDEQIADRFGFFMEALHYGAPPHGGMALGIDRIAMLACGEDNIREVIAFPKNQQGRDIMMDAPSPASSAQLRELGLALTAAASAPQHPSSPPSLETPRSSGVDGAAPAATPPRVT
jgi:aspartyl-tRNA synthetase